jgi:hypothetical protein
MKNIKLNAAKSLFIIALFCPFAFADGDQGSGGFANTDAPVVKTSESSMEGDQGSGGRTASTADASYIDTVLISVSEYFDWLI